MHKTDNYQDIQRSSFSELVNRGDYSESFEHAAHAQDFFYKTLSYASSQIDKAEGFSFLDCGCGPGAWLDFVANMGLASAPSAYYGFDLTEEMVSLAKKRLERSAPAQHFHTGDILADEAYQFPGGPEKYDLIMTYDVIQQLPKELQYKACQKLLSYVAQGGIAIIFDNDSNSPFGRKMAFRKFVTRYLNIELVPRYFCNAHYPPLTKFAARLGQDGQYVTEIKVSENGSKRALLVRKP